VAILAMQRNPNWVMRGFVLVSAALHLILLLHVSGLVTVDCGHKIEVALFDSHPAARSLPRPRPRQVQPPLAQAQPVSALPRLLPQPVAQSSEAPPDAADSIAAEPAVALPAGALSAALGAVDRSTYFDMVRQRIEHHKRYPLAARKRQVQGKVILRFTISEKGDLKNVNVLRSSKNSDLDQAAMDAIRSAAPYPPPPRDLGQQELALELAIFFELS
jgi:protein TonB